MATLLGGGAIAAVASNAARGIGQSNTDSSRTKALQNLLDTDAEAFEDSRRHLVHVREAHWELVQRSEEEDDTDGVLEARVRASQEMLFDLNQQHNDLARRAQEANFVMQDVQTSLAQSRWTFHVAFWMNIAAILAFLAGVYLMLTGDSLAVGAVISTVGGLAKLSGSLIGRQARQKSDEADKKIARVAASREKSRSIATGLQIANRIPDGPQKNALLQSIALEAVRSTAAVGSSGEIEGPKPS